jgi:protein-S-isoprenylcysteine O-methyltransferase Ste14
MNELAYRILLAAPVIAMNLIRMYYQKRYKLTHATTESEIAPKREKRLTQMMFFALAVPGMMWLFTGWLSFGQLALPDCVRIAGFVIGVYGMWWFYRIHRTLGDNWSPVLEIRKRIAESEALFIPLT